MPRLLHFGALLGIAACWCAPLSAQKSVPDGARVRHVVVRGTGDNMEIEIQTSGAPVAPDTQAITGPDRIVVDFPGALPAAELRGLQVNRGALKGVRSGLFFSNPPITRIVLDLAKPRSYRISNIQNAVVVKLGAEEPSREQSGRENPGRVAARAVAPDGPPAHGAKLQNASLSTGTTVGSPRIFEAVSRTAPLAVVSEVPAPKPAVTVTFADGMLRIQANRATLAQVLFEVHRQTLAEIAIPAGAELEEVFVDLGPAPARDVLASLLNGTPYNFIFVGNEQSLEQVILSRREPEVF